MEKVNSGLRTVGQDARASLTLINVVPKKTFDSNVGSRSPTEYDDPLFANRYESFSVNTRSDHGSHEHSIQCTYSHFDDEGESPYNSLDYEQQSDQVFGTTPPNPRERRRIKEKGRYSRAKLSQMHELLSHEDWETKRMNRRRWNSSLSGPDVGHEANDSDGGIMDTVLAKETGPRRKKELKARHGDRNSKYPSVSFDDNESLTSSLEIDQMTVSGTMKIDTRNRFMCLHSKQVVKDDGSAPDYIHLPKNTTDAHTMLTVPQVPSGTLSTIDCPPDRYEFYRNFSALIKLGNTCRKEKEARFVAGTGGGSQMLLNIFGRQMSSEQELWTTHLSDLIWLELQAYINLRSMKEQDAWLCEMRGRVRSDLELVLNFRANVPDLQSQLTNSDGLVSCCCHRHNVVICLQQVLHHQCSVLQQATELLVNVENSESLYPTQRAFCNDYPVYGSGKFQRRISTLCLWITITRDIAHKLRLMAEILQLDLSAYGCARKWGCVDFSCLDSLIHGSDVSSCFSDDEVSADDNLDDVDNVMDDEVEVSNNDISGKREMRRLKSVRFKDDVSDDNGDDPIVQNETGMSISKAGNSGLEHLAGYAYRSYIDVALKKNGLRKLRMRLKELLDRTLQRARYALVKPDGYAVPECITLDGHSSPPLSTDQAENRALLLTHGTWSEEFVEMALPSFRPTYLFLVRIPLDIIHECLKLRLEQRPDNDPSLLSLKQLIHECKEVINAAVTVKQFYLQMVCSVASHGDSLDLDMECYEDDLKKMLEVYFDYIQAWMSGLQQLPEMSKRLKNFLEEEWNFTKRVCPHVRGGEANAGNRFCLMASSLLRSTADFLETGVDECLNQLYDTALNDSTDLSPDVTFSSNNENIFLSPFQLNRKSGRSVILRQAMIQTCRHFKDHFREARERSSKALGFAKMLRKDLELAAEFHINCLSGLYKILRQSNHARVTLQNVTNCHVFIPESIARSREHILQLLSITCGHDDLLIAGDFHTSVVDAEENGYLVLVQNTVTKDFLDIHDLEEHTTWRGAEVSVELTVETAIALSHIKVDGLFLVVSNSSPLAEQRKKFERLMGSAIELRNEQTSCHEAIADSIVELKNAAINLRQNVASAISQIDEKLSIDDLSEMDDGEKINVVTLFRETLHQCYNFGFEYHRELTRLVSGDARAKMSTALVEFANQWMKFVARKCERGRGLRPRWANQGLEFLLVACEPRVMATLTDKQFMELKKCINECVTHVIGDKITGGLQTPPSRSSPDLLQQKRLQRIQSMPEAKRPTYGVSPGFKSEPNTPYVSSSTPVLRKNRFSSIIPLDAVTDDDDDPGITFKAHYEISYTTAAGTKSPPNEPCILNDCALSVETRRKKASDKLLASLRSIEQKRVDVLFTNRLIGRPTNSRVDVDYHINLRRVNFRWQRGIKIGEGSFGKVYTAVNMDTGSYMAMKEIPIKDHQSLKGMADEIKIFEGITHPNLVHYYGVEIYRHEMIIFMEYCSHGTIEEAARQGLTEDMIRRYTKDILVAIDVLHEHHIVHRDIKGANVFLTADGSVKLGDFGCSVKLKADTTLPGELVSHGEGTPAFMAPEVIVSPETAGRAADIWSLGCVVIEMATGRRPWSELENKVQIMFKVGMGQTPRMPESLSDEGREFLSHCLVSDPQHRWTASTLKDHPFVKVYSEDDADA